MEIVSEHRKATLLFSSKLFIIDSNWLRFIRINILRNWITLSDSIHGILRVGHHGRGVIKVWGRVLMDHLIYGYLSREPLWSTTANSANQMSTIVYNNLNVVGIIGTVVGMICTGRQ